MDGSHVVKSIKKVKLFQSLLRLSFELHWGDPQALRGLHGGRRGVEITIKCVTYMCMAPKGRGPSKGFADML